MKYLFLLLPCACLLAQPKGMQTMSGLAELSESGHTLTITNSDKAILHWEDFSIAKGEITRFVQPDAHSSVLNRITGPDISKIMGRLESNGSVVLINERGLIVGPDGVIDTAGFIGSTFDVLDESFLKGKELLFEGEGQGDIIHMGHINARGGQIYLNTGRDAIVEGTINAPRASVTLEGGRMILREEALVDVSDKNAPGEVSLYASVIRLEKGSEIKADSVTSDAGSIMVMSEEQTHFYGHISAQSVEGEGGRAEVSSHEHLWVTGHANLRSKEGRDGFFILDPGSVDIISGGNTPPPASMDTFNDGYINAQLAMSSLTISTENSTNGGAETLTVDGTAAISWSTPNQLQLIGRQNLEIHSGASIISTNSGSTAFTALALQGNTMGVSGAFDGISIDGATISTVAGSISMEGVGGGSSQSGIRFLGSTALTTMGSGSITLQGTGAASGTTSNLGVNFSGLTVVTLGANSTGDLTVTGLGGGDGTSTGNSGIGITGSVQSLSTASSAGKMTLIGVGGSGTTGNHGVFLEASGVVETVNGDLELNGIGNGTGGTNVGILVGSSTPIETTGTGSIEIIGQGAAGGSTNTGVAFTDGGVTLDTTSTGRLTITGTCIGDATGLGNLGVSFTDATFESLNTTASAGGITISGTGGLGTISCHGMDVTDTVMTTVNGDISLTGTGGGEQSAGIIFITSSSVTSTGEGSIKIVGQGGPQGTFCDGVFFTNTLASGLTLGAASTGSLTVRGTGGGDDIGGPNRGIVVQNNIVIASLSTAASPGRILLDGRGSIGNQDCHGVFFSDNAGLTTIDANVRIVGRGGGTTVANHGVQLDTSTPIASTGSGRLSFDGIAGPGGSGVNVEGTGGVTSSSSGTISMLGTGGATGQHGVAIESPGFVSSTGTGRVKFDGTGAPIGSNNAGVRVTGNVTSLSGEMTIIGRTSGTGTSGVTVTDGGNIETTDSARMTVTAFSDVVLNGPATITGGTSPITINSSRDVVLTGGSGASEPAAIELGTGDASFNIGRNLILTGGAAADSEAQIGARSASSSAKMTFNVNNGSVLVDAPSLATYALIGHGDDSFTGTLGGNINLIVHRGNIVISGASAGAGALGFAQIGHADFTASTLNGDVKMTANGNVRIIGGNAGASANARIGNGGLGNAASFGGSDMRVTAGLDIDMISRIGEAQVQNFNGPLTLVVDNQYPIFPSFGTGSFVLNSLLTATGDLRIYSVVADQNTINDQINGINFVAGPIDVDNAFQQFNIYFPFGTYEGTPFKIYYKQGLLAFRAIQFAAIHPLTIANAQLTDLLPIFRYMRLANYPVYHGEFCEFDYALEFHCNPELAPYGSFIFEDDIYWIDAVR